MKKVLFIVPHEDDELFIGGPLLINLIREKGYEVYILIATNGDYYPYEHQFRIKESIAVLTRIGVKKEKIIFLGYGDCWKGCHIYNSDEDEIKESIGGYTETYISSGHNEWHYQLYNCHQKYTRNGYLGDIKSVITTIFPDIIVCVDMDKHRDHRCLSLLTEEALSLVLKENIEYKPNVLKKFAYQGVLFGEYDFFTYPHKRTVNQSNDTWNPFLKWEDRISYRIPDDCNTIFLHNNFLYKLVKMYHTQDMWVRSPSFINDDIVFWMRNVNNEMLHSSISVSSGEKKYLNDFKLVDCLNIQEEELCFSELCWHPDALDEKKEILAEFDNSVQVSTVNIYFNCPKGLSGEYVIELDFSDGKKKAITRQVNTVDNYYIDSVDFDTSRVISIKFILKNMIGDLGIGEIEVLSKKQDIPFQELLYSENKHSISPPNIFLNFALLLEKIVFTAEKKIYYHTDSWIKRRKNYERSLL